MTAITQPLTRGPRRGAARGRLLDRSFKYLFLAPAALYVIAFFGYPLAKNLMMSFQEYTQKTFFTGEAPWVGFANYLNATSSSIFTASLVNTALFTVGSIVGQFAIGMAVAVFFSRKFPLNNLLRGLLLLPWLLPSVASGAVWRMMFEQDSGIINVMLKGAGVISEPISWLTSTQLALTSVIILNIWAGIPFNAIILYSGIQEIPEELYEAAALDGAGAWRRFWHITMPSLRPVIMVLLALGAVYTIRSVDGILALTGGGPARSSTTLPVLAYQETFVSYDFGAGAALSTLLMLIAMVFAILYVRANQER
jgi:multiple sugar transport system permease protein